MFIGDPRRPTDVSRETFPESLRKNLEIYEALMRAWNPKINLIAPNTLDQIWERHFYDSLQLAQLVTAHYPRSSNPIKWLDLGSGGGFPALVVAAAMGVDVAMDLVESDQRKCTFLEKVARDMGIQARVHNVRIESLAPQAADIISARALAPLEKLVGLACPHGHKNTVYLFPKGKNWKAELEITFENWHMVLRDFVSQTDQDARILWIEKLEKKL